VIPAGPKRLRGSVGHLGRLGQAPWSAVGEEATAGPLEGAVETVTVREIFCVSNVLFMCIFNARVAPL